MKKIIVTFVLLFFAASPALAWDNSSMNWDNRPENWNNRPENWENRPENWENRPENWNNRPENFNNNRIIRDEQGNAKGYIVPKPSGGANIFDMDGNRKAYIPAGD